MPKGMMLAAGRGTRLGPLTERTPKPLLPVANRPVMAQGIAALRRQGIHDIGVNVSYLGEQIIDVFGDGHHLGVTLHWQQEPEPTGTAGGLKGLQSLLGEDLIVLLSGDGMHDLDLAPLLAFHREQGAFITMATIPVDDPSQYGVVATDAANRIHQFQEKPAPGTEISHQTNTGIYVFDPGIFDLIPCDQYCDFARHVFPEVLQRGLPFYALPVEGYWTDIGKPGDYLQANLDFLDGKMAIAGDGEMIDGSLLAPNCEIDDTSLTRCVIGQDAVVSPGCRLTDCVVWPGAIIDEPVELEAAVITRHGIFRIDDRHVVPIAVGA